MVGDVGGISLAGSMCVKAGEMARESRGVEGLTVFSLFRDFALSKKNNLQLEYFSLLEGVDMCANEV